jgi:PHS family inorganic phosphate transporter-like MFS transporter
MTDKYMLGATNFVEHYAEEFHATDEQKNFVKAAMYCGAVIGMIGMGPASDIVGRRKGLIACSFITLAGALLSAFAWSENVLIGARIITGIGMGGEYPLASSHSAESSKNTSDGAKNIALLYLFGSGGGQALCPLVTYFMDVAGVPGETLWRWIFGVGAMLSFFGLILRYYATKDSAKFTQAKAAEKAIRMSSVSILAPYWRALIGTAGCWLLFDVVEYGLKQNDAAIFSAEANRPFSDSVLTVFFTRILVIPSLAFAPWFLKQVSSKRVQLIGFLGCLLANVVLAIGSNGLKQEVLLFDALYIMQLSFQSLPGVTTMAISAEIFPSAVRGTAAGISAASGKIGATIGSYVFSELKNKDEIAAIFWSVVGTMVLATFLTLVAIPLYNGRTLDLADSLAREGRVREAAKMLYSGPKAEEGKEAMDDLPDKEGDTSSKTATDTGDSQPEPAITVV